MRAKYMTKWQLIEFVEKQEQQIKKLKEQLEILKEYSIKQALKK